MTKYLRAHSLVSLLDARDGEKVGRKYALPRPDVLHSSHTWSVHLRASAVTPSNEDRQDGVLGWCFKLSALQSPPDWCLLKARDRRQENRGMGGNRESFDHRRLLLGNVRWIENVRRRPWLLKRHRAPTFLKGLSIYLLLTVRLQQRRSQSAEGAR